MVVWSDLVVLLAILATGIDVAIGHVWRGR